MRGRVFVFLTQIFILVLLSPSLRAGVVAEYDAGVPYEVAAAPDPLTFGWTLEMGPDPGLSVASVSPDAATGLNAWNTTDNTNANSEYVRYVVGLTADEQAKANRNGWTMSCIARHITNFNDDATNHLYYIDQDQLNFLIWIWLDEDTQSDSFGDLYMTIRGHSEHRITFDGNGSLRYHEYKMR